MRKLPIALRSIVALCALLTVNAIAHGDEDHAQAKQEAPASPASTALNANLAAPQRLADGSLFIPKSLQRLLGLRTQVSQLSALSATVELNGKIIPDPDAAGRVQANFSGSIFPGPTGMPTLGKKVLKDEILAYLSPTGSAIERGNQLAQQAELEAQLEIAARRLSRYEQLVGAVPQKEIDAARIERDALKKRRDFVGASINARTPLRAPASGIVSASYVVAGQMVDAKELLFDIVDPDRLAVEALAYDSGIAATLISASGLAEQTALELKFVGSGRQLREQALPLLFRITTKKPAVAVGQPLKVILRTDQGIKGMAMARSALTKIGSGETVVWVHVAAERFVARRVRQQALDAMNIAITDGLHEGDRVVTLGAGLLSEVR